MVNKILLIAFATVTLSVSVCYPRLFLENNFLENFITFEVLNVLAVILTVTLASVANIHLSLNRIVRAAFRDREKGEHFASQVRKEINQNSWVLLFLFAASCVILFIKGHFENNGAALAVTNALMIIVIAAHLFVLYDIYSTVYKLVPAEGSFGGSK